MSNHLLKYFCGVLILLLSITLAIMYLQRQERLKMDMYRAEVNVTELAALYFAFRDENSTAFEKILKCKVLIEASDADTVYKHGGDIFRSSDTKNVVDELYQNVTTIMEGDWIRSATMKHNCGWQTRKQEGQSPFRGDSTKEDK